MEPININLWNAITEHHKEKIGKELYSFLFDEAKPIILNKNKLIILTDKFALNFLNEHSANYNSFKATCTELLYTSEYILKFDNLENEITYTESNSVQPHQNTQFLERYVEENKIPNYTKFEETTFAIKKGNKNIEYERTKLMSNLTFKNFFYSYENKQVIKGAQLLIQEINNPSFNPLFIYGTSGIGKTHLLNAIGNKIYDLNLNKNILYLQSTDFLEEYTSLFKGGIDNTDKIKEFKHKYANIDVLLIDDIQLLETKEGSLNEFFAIFEKLKNNNKIIIISSDKHPNKIHFEERLISRFLSGLNCEMKLPDTDTKKEIFNYYALEKDINVEEDAITLFIDNSTNVRELLGYLNSITVAIISNDIEGSQIKRIDAQKILKNNNGKPNELSENDIINIVTDHFHVSKTELKSKNKKQNIVNARHFSAYFLRKRLNYKHQKISYVLNFNDHSAALNAIKAAEKKIKLSKYKDDYLKLSRLLET